MPTHEVMSVITTAHYQMSFWWGHKNCWYCLYSSGQCCASPLPGFPTSWLRPHNLSSYLKIPLLLSVFQYCPHPRPRPASPFFHVPESTSEQSVWNSLKVSISSSISRVTLRYGPRDLDSPPCPEPPEPSCWRTRCRIKLCLDTCGLNTGATWDCLLFRPNPVSRKAWMSLRGTYPFKPASVCNSAAPYAPQRSSPSQLMKQPRAPPWDFLRW